MAFWVHDLDPVILQLTDTLAIRWYGLAYVCGFLAGFGLLALYWKRGRSQVGPQAQESLAIALILGVVIGGRLGYFLLYEPLNFLRDPLVLLRVWEGGMASHGGFAGVALAGLWVARKHRIDPLHLGDLVVTATPPGLLLGRIANFINGELWGKVSEVPWAVIFPGSAAPGMPVEFIAPRHPSQLYAAALEGLVPLVYLQIRFWTRGRALPPGQLMGEFLVLYALMRITAELFREPDAALILGLSRGTVYSAILLAGGAIFLYFIRHRQLTKPRSR